MRIKKVKLTKEGKIHLEYEERNKADSWDEFSMTCSDEATPEFYAALAALAPHVRDMCELPARYLDRITVRGVSASYAGDNDTMGATIIAQMELRHSNTNMNITTPHKASEPYSDTGEADEKQLLDEDCTSDLETLFDECIKYIKGERKQLKLAV